MYSTLRFIIISLLILILAVGVFSKFTDYLEASHLSQQQASVAQQKMITTYEKILVDLAEAKAKLNKSDHDVWYVGHLEKTKLHLERFLPYQDDSSPAVSRFININLAVIENIFMFSLMIFAALFYILKGQALKKDYPLTPGLKQARHREPPTGLVADKTYWQPMRSGGASFQTHSLKILGHDKLLLKASGQVKAFFMVFILVGLNGMIFSLLKYVQRSGLDAVLNDPLALIESLFSVGLIFVIVGIVLGSRFGSLNTLFDKKAGLVSNNNDSAQLSSIHALQIIEETVGGNQGSVFKSYELNVVLKDGERIHLMDHGNYLAINTDAEKLAGFLSVPIWENG
jgi:hypothetical protein